jgi:predicted dienelactone hydrolase
MSRVTLTVLSLAVTLWLFQPATHGRAATYNPLELKFPNKPRALELVVHDASRSRDIPVRIYLEEQKEPAPVVLFSHGLGGSRNGDAFLGEHWAQRGYVAVFLQHPGSDTSVWQTKPKQERIGAMREAISLENFKARVDDVHSVLDALTAWNKDKTQALFGKLDLNAVGMSGHSFGAVTTEAVSGEHFPIAGTKFTDARIKAAIAFSPSAPHHGEPAEAFGAVHIPWLLMTGTQDVVPALGRTDLKSRLAVYPALHGAPKYQVILENAEHSAFTDRALPGDHEPRNPNHHRVMLALTTAFLDAYLRHDAAALKWLNGDGPRGILQPGDDWKLAAK